MPEVVLIGYYGRMNFGDDVLMAVTHGIARKIMPGATIALRMATPGNYPARLLSAPVGHLPFGTRGNHQLIIHGGGGTFFDFIDYGPWERLKNAALFAMGKDAFIHADRWTRKVTGRPKLSGHNRIGLGIGVGTYTAGSPKLRQNLPVLADFDALWLRDPASVANVRRLGVNVPLIAGSDLAFLSDAWCPADLLLSAHRPRPTRPRLGVILRDWPTATGESFARRIAPALSHLAIRYEVTLIFLDLNTDGGAIRELQGVTQQIWQPEQQSLAWFAGFLAEQDVLLTARAHGAICGACVGRASVILGIKPKLAAVHGMLPGASRFAAPDSTGPELETKIEEALAISSDSIAADVLRNRATSEQALTETLSRVAL